jgi:hypothetical protein
LVTGLTDTPASKSRRKTTYVGALGGTYLCCPVLTKFEQQKIEQKVFGHWFSRDVNEVIGVMSLPTVVLLLLSLVLVK